MKTLPEKRMELPPLFMVNIIFRGRKHNPPGIKIRVNIEYDMVNQLGCLYWANTQLCNQNISISVVTQIKEDFVVVYSSQAIFSFLIKPVAKSFKSGIDYEKSRLQFGTTALFP